jgi:hypothetical protein
MPVLLFNLFLPFYFYQLKLIYSYHISFRKAKIVEEPEEFEAVESDSQMLTELSRLEKLCCKENFQYYDKQKLGYVERFEL